MQPTLPAALRTGLRFLTVLPVPLQAAERDPAGATAWFPLVGLVLAVPLYLGMLLPLPPIPRAALVLALWISMTGGLHEDGCLDCLDAAFAPVRRERRLEILKDPHVGAHAVNGGVVLLLLRFGALTAVAPVAALAAPVVGRWAMAVSLALARPARSDGLGADFAAAARPVAATFWTATLLAGIAFLASRTMASGPLPVASSWALGALAAVGCGRFLTRRFGGLTGDGHGAVGIVAELAALWAFMLANPGGA